MAKLISEVEELRLTKDKTILEDALARGELDLSDDEDDGAPSPKMSGLIVGEVELSTSEVGVHDEIVMEVLIGMTPFEPDRARLVFLNTSSGMLA
ncbi:unnamed protein product [Prunus armeniaca]|uniref:Uncharacterized protein n=1 Tax=Prunus armeniaca TaxID=36596 RepID=A0A6J5VL03_PRUAR|nr:unnamed protein product [Prunus armeniaca]CAB4320206.1 unnamed protein product [Prunus armeniaca]